VNGIAFSSARYALKNLRLWYWQRGAFGVLMQDDPGTMRWLSAISWPALLVVVGAAVTVWRRDSTSRLGIAWVAVFLLPVVNLVPLGNTPVSMHYLYLPGVGLALLLGRGVMSVIERTEPRSMTRALASACGLSIVALWLPEYIQTVSAWSSGTSLYASTLRNHPENVEVRANLVAAYMQQDELAEADALLVESLQIAPGDPALVGNRFELLWQMRRWAEALAFLDSHETLRGEEFLYRRGKLLEALGRPLDAIPVYAQVADKAVAPNLRFAAGYQRATILVNVGRLAEAKRAIEGMLAEFPDDARLHLTYRAMMDADSPAD
jgi:hypothetical protein